MSNIFQIKRRLSGDQAGSSEVFSLNNGELAYNENNEALYIGHSAATGNKLTIAGPGKYTTLASNQTVDGDKTFQGAVNLGAAAVAATADINENSTIIASTEFVHNVASVLDGGSY
jgi:hypothetical protein